MVFEFLKDLVIIFGISAVVVYTLGRLRVPSIIGFLLAGVIMGPHGFGLIGSVHEVEVFAEIGVILLMFTIGLEFSLKHLLMLRTAVLGGGFLQVAASVALIGALAVFVFQDTLRIALFDGALVALSSTAIVIKLLMDRAEINSPHGRSIVGILIFQDLCVVPFMLLIPILAGTGGSMQDILITMIKAAMVIGAVIASSRWGVPHLLHQVVRTKSRELFVITIILLCIGTALLTWELGLSLALGAFLAGIVISESDYAAQAISDVVPFKESFTGLFFISIGMLMDLRFLGHNLHLILPVVITILALKILSGTLAAYAIGQTVRHSVMTGFYLSQIGEFSFILAQSGKAQGLMTEDLYQVFLSASVLTMLATPLMVALSSPVSSWLVSRKLLGRFDRSQRGVAKDSYPKKKSGHVIIVGFGINGRNLARVLRESEIPYVILELNSNTVKAMKKKGEPIYFGDGTSPEILRKLRIHAARMLVIAISDAAATRRIVQVARREHPGIQILVRTRYVAEVDDLKELGANEVIPEEFETSVEIFSRVLSQYGLSGDAINDHVEKVRKDSYRMLRGLDLPRKELADHYEFLKGLSTETYRIPENCAADGRSLQEIQLRSRTGATIIAVQRALMIYQNPSPDFVFRAGDIILLIGDRESIDGAINYIGTTGRKS